MKNLLEKSKVYKVQHKNGTIKVQVSVMYSGHQKKYYVNGSEFGVLSTGGAEIDERKSIKQAMNHFIKTNNLTVNGSISHDIYGIYSVEVI